MNNPIIPKLETQQKYPLFYAEATKTINDIIEHITKERGIYTSNIEPDPKEHNIWFNTNDNKIYRWVEEEQSWKTISGNGGSEIVYVTEVESDFYNGKTYIFDGNKYGTSISRVSPIEPITNFEAILINCDFISSNNSNYDIDIMFKYINGDTNTIKGIYYVKYIDGYCIVTKLTDNIVIYGSDIKGALLINAEDAMNVPEGIVSGENYIEIIDNEVEVIGIHVDEASMLEIPKDITFYPFQSFEISKLILYGDINLYYSNINESGGSIDTLICYNKNVELLDNTQHTYIDTIITDHPIKVSCVTVQTNNYSKPPFGKINTMILCNTGNYYEIDNNYNVELSHNPIPMYTLYGKFNINFTLNYLITEYGIVFTEIPEYIKIRDFTETNPITLFIYCKPEHKEQIQKLITDAKLAENIHIIYRLIEVNHISDEINIVNHSDLDITIYKNYIK